MRTLRAMAECVLVRRLCVEAEVEVLEVFCDCDCDDADRQRAREGSCSVAAGGAATIGGSGIVAMLGQRARRLTKLTLSPAGVYHARSRVDARQECSSREEGVAVGCKAGFVGRQVEERWIRTRLQTASSTMGRPQG
jgi:hypothetical protein